MVIRNIKRRIHKAASKALLVFQIIVQQKLVAAIMQRIIIHIMQIRERNELNHLATDNTIALGFQRIVDHTLHIAKRAAEICHDRSDAFVLDREEFVGIPINKRPRSQLIPMLVFGLGATEWRRHKLLWNVVRCMRDVEYDRMVHSDKNWDKQAKLADTYYRLI